MIPLARVENKQVLPLRIRRSVLLRLGSTTDGLLSACITVEPAQTLYDRFAATGRAVKCAFENRYEATDSMVKLVQSRIPRHRVEKR